MGCRIFFVMRVGGLHVFKENLKSVHLIKKHRNNFLFSYYDLGFRCFERLIYFRTASILFDLKNLNLSKHFESLTGRTHCLPVIRLI